MLLKAVLINRTEIFTSPDTHYDAMIAYLSSRDDEAAARAALDNGTVDIQFGYVDSEKLDQFNHHQFESVERRGERWLGVRHEVPFQLQPPLHDDPSEFTGGWTDEINEMTPLQMDYLCGKVKGNNK